MPERGGLDGGKEASSPRRRSRSGGADMDGGEGMPLPPWHRRGVAAT